MYNYIEADWNTVCSSTTYTIKYKTTYGHTITRTFDVQEHSPADLDAGDTTHLDSFLEEFLAPGT